MMSIKIKILLITLVIILLMVAIYLYAMIIGTSGFYVKEYLVKSDKLPEEYDGFKIAHLSDIHYGNRSTKKSDIEKIVKDVNKLKPDIIVITGDLVDDEITNKQYEELVDALRKLEATTGKYIIDGNHDYGYKKWSQLVEDAYFTNLNDSYLTIFKDSSNSIFLAGVSNNTYSKKKITEKTETLYNYLNSEEYKSSFSILLLHEPDYIEKIDYSKFDLVLAGHSHNGQVRLPFIGPLILPNGCKKYYDEYYKLKNTDLYISSGIGTSTLPIRLFNRPSYNFYRLVKKTTK